MFIEKQPSCRYFYRKDTPGTCVHHLIFRYYKPSTHLNTIPKSEPALELHSRAAPCVEAHHRVSVPNTARNLGGRLIKKACIPEGSFLLLAFRAKSLHAHVRFPEKKIINILRQSNVFTSFNDRLTSLIIIDKKVFEIFLSI